MQYLWQIHKLDFNRMRKSSRFNSRLQDFREVEQIWGLVNSPFEGPGNSHSTKEVEIQWHLSLVCAMITMALPTKAITTSFKISSHLCVWYCLLLNSLSSDYKLLNSPRDAEAAPLSPHRTESAHRGGALSWLCVGPKLSRPQTWTQSCFTLWITWNTALSAGVSTAARRCITMQKCISRCFNGEEQVLDLMDPHAKALQQWNPHLRVWHIWCLYREAFPTFPIIDVYLWFIKHQLRIYEKG